MTPSRSPRQKRRYTACAALLCALACGSCITLKHDVQLGKNASQSARGFSPQAERRMIYTYVGRIYESVEDYPHAIDFFKKKLDAYPTHPASGQRAIMDAERAVVLNQMGTYAYRLGRYDEALNYFRRSLRLTREQDILHGEVVNSANIGKVVVQALAGASEREALSEGASGRLVEAAQAQRRALKRIDESPEYRHPEYRVYLRANLAALAQHAAAIGVMLPLKVEEKG